MLRISVVTAVFNAASTVEECLRSVDSQSHGAVEHVLVDGGSTDGTLDRVRAFQGRRVSLVSEPDRGIYDAMNKGIRRATGEVVGILGADDVYADGAVLADVAAALDRTGADSCYGDLEYVRRDAPEKVVRRWRSGPYRPGLFRRGWMPPHPTFFVRKTVYDRLGLFRDDFRIAADYELMLRFFEKGCITTSYIPRVLVRMRLGGASNRGLRNLWRKSREDRRAWEVNGLEGGWSTIVAKNLSKLPQFVRGPGG